MISLQIVAEFLDACGGWAKIMASPPQVLTAGAITRYRARESVPMQQGLDSPLCVPRHVIHAPVIAAPNRCYDYQISHGARNKYRSGFGFTCTVFLPRDAVLARCTLSSRVRLSVICGYCVKTTERIELGFARNASFHLSYTALWVAR